MDSIDKIEKAECISPPPPYSQDFEKIDPDGFPQFDAVTPVTEVTVQPRPSSTAKPPIEIEIASAPPLVTKPAPPTPTPQADFSANMPESQGENCQSEVFQKPPKFLLYPTMAVPCQETEQFRDGAPQPQHQPMDQMTAGVGQVHHTAPAVFAVPQAQIANQAQQLTPLQGPFPREAFMPRYSHRAMCPYCRIPVVTETEYVSGTLTHLAAFALCWIGCCCCMPYFINDLKDVEHYCPHCNNILGYHHKHLC